MDYAPNSTRWWRRLEPEKAGKTAAFLYRCLWQNLWVTEPGFSQDELARAIAPVLEVPPGKLRFFRSATGRFNETWFVEGAGRPLVVRIAPPDDRSRMLFYEHRMMWQEPEIHAIVRERTECPVPEVVALKKADPLLGRDYIVLERVPGTPLSEVDGLTRQKLDRLFARCGECLRQVHSITGTSHGYRGPHRPMEPQHTWMDAFAVMWHKLIDDIRACDGYDEEEADGMRRLLDRHIRLFESDIPASLLHMDVWAENILCDDQGGLTGLIDWDRALWGDPEIEFAVLDYCGISTPAFWEGYGQPRDTGPEAKLRGVFYLLYEIQKYIVIQRVRRRDPDAADRYRMQALSLAESIDEESVE